MKRPLYIIARGIVLYFLANAQTWGGRGCKTHQGRA